MAIAHSNRVYAACDWNTRWCVSQPERCFVDSPLRKTSRLSTTVQYLKMSRDKVAKTRSSFARSLFAVILACDGQKLGNVFEDATEVPGNGIESKPARRHANSAGLLLLRPLYESRDGWMLALERWNCGRQIRAPP
jgi:hypothetical protein